MTQTSCYGSEAVFSEERQSSDESGPTQLPAQQQLRLFTATAVTAGGCLRQQELLLLPSSSWLFPAMGTAPAAERTGGW